MLGGRHLGGSALVPLPAFLRLGVVRLEDS
jgi:hypothetical protein